MQELAEEGGEKRLAIERSRGGCRDRGGGGVEGDKARKAEQTELQESHVFSPCRHQLVILLIYIDIGQDVN